MATERATKRLIAAGDRLVEAAQERFAAQALAEVVAEWRGAIAFVREDTVIAVFCGVPIEEESPDAAER